MLPSRTACIAAVMLVAIALTSSAAEFSVAPGGSDEGPGTDEAPFATLVRARDAVRAWRKAHPDAVETVTVWLAAGTYELTATVELDERDSGTAEGPTVFRAREGEDVRLSGGRAIPVAGATAVTDPAILQRLPEEARGRVLHADLRAAGIEDFGQMQPRGFRRPYVPAPLELFVGDRPMQLARWPNEGTVPIGEVLDPGSVPRDGDYSDRGGTFRLSDDRPLRWGKADDIWLSGLWNYGYADDTIPVAAIDADARTVTMGCATMYGIAAGRPWQRYFALNLLEEIDRPGEYYVDRTTGMLYFWPPEGFSPTSSRLCVSMLQEPLVALEGASHVRFEGITFECSRGMGVYIERGESCLLGGCTFRNLGIVAVCIGKGTEPLQVYAHEGTAPAAGRKLGSWHEHIYANSTFDRQGGSNHGVVGCDIYDTGAGGVSLGGGDRRTLTAAGNFVRNCHIRHFNRLDRSYKAGVNIDGVGNRIERCLIHDCPNNAIYLHGNDHIIDGNEIHHAVRLADDMGAFYMGRDPSEYGNVLRHNLFHHNGSEDGSTCVVYFDDSSCGTLVQGNVFCQNKGGIWINGGYNHRFEGNVFVDDRAEVSDGWPPERWHVYMTDELLQKRLLRDLDIAAAPYSERYPGLLELYRADPANAAAHGQEVVGNVSVRSGGFGQGRNRVKDNWTTEEDPGFANAAEMDFSLSPESRVFRNIPDFAPIPLDRVGLYVGDYRKTVPLDAPAIEGAGRFVRSQTVALRKPRGALGVVYTLDGSGPTMGSPRYEAPLSVTDDTTVRAMAFGPGKPASLSSVATRAFVRVRPRPVTEARVSFQPSDGRPPEGWLVDTGQEFTLAEGQIAFGWTQDNTEAARRRGRNEDPLLDTLVHFSQGTLWQIAVEDGQYELTVCIGDAEYACENQTILVEGLPFVSGLSLQANQFERVTGRVTVADGTLTLGSNNAPHGPGLTRMAYLEFRRAE